MRKKNTIKNFLTDIIPYFVFAILGFVQVKIFINSLGEEIYSLNQLFIQLFSYISLVEGGAGAIIAQKYYKLFVDENKEKIKETYVSSIHAMKKISLIIMIIGFCLSFFLELLTKNSLSLLYMQVVFLLYTFRSVIEYLNISPRFVIQGDQKGYKINIILNIFKLIDVIIEIILLLYGLDYIIILIFSIFTKIIMYYFVNKKVYSLYPWLKETKNIEPISIKGIGYMYYHKIAGAVYNNTDLLLISSKLSPFEVTMYSFYNYICKYISDFVYMIGNSLMASLGNVIYKETNEKSFEIFDEINSFFLFIATFCGLNVCLLSDSFISLWIGNEYTVNNFLAIFMAFLLFFSISKRILALVCETKGLYKETKNIVIIEAIANVVLSLILINYFDIAGVLAATVISYFITTFWYYPKYVFNNIFDKSSKLYFKNYFIGLFTFIILFVIYRKLIYFNINNSLIWFVIAFINAVISGIIIFTIFYLFIPSYKRIIKKLLSMIRR